MARCRRPGVVVVVVALIALLAGASCSVGPERSVGQPSGLAVSTPPKPATPPEPPDTWVAAATVPSVAVYDAPSGPQPTRALSNPTAENYPLVFRVEERQGDWVRVKLAVRPNGSTGWVRAGDVSLSSTPYRVVVEVGAHRVSLYRGDEVVFQDAVAVGTARAPTPTGDFFMDAIWPLANAGGVFGPYQLSVAAFSDVLKSFDGGQGQIALHGTNAPGLLGTSVSHGCVRLRNETITKLAQTAPVGTPVQIVA